MAKQCNLYENPVLQTFTGDIMRPGGFRITLSAMLLAELPPGSSILDLGCGSGKTVEFLEAMGYCPVGIDISTALLQKGRQRNPWLPIFWGDGQKLPFPDSSFQAVICECTLSVLKERQQALAEIRRVLRPGGSFLLSDFYIRDTKSGVEFTGLPIGTCLNGITTRENIFNQLKEANIPVLKWEDKTDLLKSFTAEIIMSYGSMQDFWQNMIEECTDIQTFTAELEKIKLGYFLAIGKKQKGLLHEN